MGKQNNKSEYNKYFETLVHDEYDIVGFISYGLYKYRKREEIINKQNDTGRLLNQKEKDEIGNKLFDKELIKFYEMKAKELLGAVIEPILIEKEVLEEQLKKKNDMENIPIDNHLPNNTFSKYVKILIPILLLISGYFGYTKYSKYNDLNTNSVNQKCNNMAIVGEIDFQDQTKIKSVSIEEQTYAEDKNVVDGKFEILNIPCINSTAITLVVKFNNGLPDKKILVPVKNYQPDNHCTIDLGKQH